MRIYIYIYIFAYAYTDVRIKIRSANMSISVYVDMLVHTYGVAGLEVSGPRMSALKGFEMGVGSTDARAYKV